MTDKPRYPRSPEARRRRAPTVRRVLEAEANQKTRRAHSLLLARALRFSLGSRNGGTDWDPFTAEEMAWMRATAERLEQS